MKISLSAATLAEIVNGQLVGSDFELASTICTDTRKIATGDVFVALSGENFDGHNYLPVALAKGSVLAIVERKNLEIDIPQILVASSLKAYGAIATYVREQFVGPVFGITGSCGKTSTKGMLTAILSEVGNVHSTQGNFNNEVGVPLTLCDIDIQRDEYAVIEMGAGKPHDIGYLANIVCPDYALVTTVAPAHLQGFGSLDAVQETKFEIFSNTKHLLGCVINGDEAYATTWQEKLALKPLKVITFGEAISNDIHLIKAEYSIEGSRFIVASPQGRLNIVLHVPGKHMVKNAMAVIGLALMAGIELECIEVGLSKYQSSVGRIAMRNVKGVNIIDDSYNANPASVKAAIDTLQMAAPRRIAVLGDMAELGDQSEQLHKDMGTYASNKIDALYCWGNFMKHAAQSYGAEARHFDDKYDMALQLSKYLQIGDTLLVKGSRSSAMEQVIEHLENLWGVQ